MNIGGVPTRTLLHINLGRLVELVLERAKVPQACGGIAESLALVNC